jgi:glycosyltransferase involved in cell wall biosynthesis
VRIGIDASATFGWRGPSRNVKNLIRSLFTVDTENEYFLFVPGEPTLDLGPLGNYTWVVVKKRRFVPWLSFSLPLSARRHRLDVFLFPHMDFWLWKPLPTVVMTRAATIAPFLKGKKEKLNAAIKKFRLDHIADRIVCVSHSNASFIRFSCGIAEAKMAVLYNAVDPFFLSATVPPVTDPKKYILYVGGTEKDKNILRLLEAYRMLVSRGSDTGNVLVIVGDVYMGFGETKDMLMQAVERLGLKDKVIFRGAIKDTAELAGIYRGATLFVFPSVLESFGLVPLEAMACGCPVVASNATAIPEILGDAALYFDPYDVEEMTEKIEKVLKDDQLRTSLVLRGKERVKRFSWENSARKLLDILEDVGKKR